MGAYSGARQEEVFWPGMVAAVKWCRKCERCTIPYRVNVYEVQLADGPGPKKQVTRTELLNTGEAVPEEGSPPVVPQDNATSCGES